MVASLSRLRGHPRRKDLFGRLGFGVPLDPHPKRILLHAVSVGEVNTLRALVPKLTDAGYDVVICVTTDTGLARAKNLFGDSLEVLRYPFDFSFAVRRFLRRVAPTIVALVELEVWPNFIGMCHKNNVPVLVINGRLSQRSFERYRFAKSLLRNTFRRLTAIGMQNDLYATRVRELGALQTSVDGTMKWDNAGFVSTPEEVHVFATELGICPDTPLIVVGSSTPEEHKLLMQVLPENVQLLVAPRRPEWFDEAANTLAPCNRRTSSQRQGTRFFLLDTIGELDKAYALADIVVVGRSFAPLHGSDPTQPIALGKPTIIGPNAGDFEDMVAMFLEGDGMIQCERDSLGDTIKELLANKEKCKQLAENGQNTIASQQGATTRYFNLIVNATPA